MRCHAFVVTGGQDRDEEVNEDRDVGGRTREERDPPTKRRGDAVDDGGSSRIGGRVCAVLCCAVLSCGLESNKQQIE